MIEYLILLWLVKYRDAFFPQERKEMDALDRALEPGAGLDFEPPPPPSRKRPDLRIV